MSEPIVSVSGVRGIIGVNLNPEVINKYVSAFARLCAAESNSKQIVIGWDGRLYGNYLKDIVSSNLIFSGFQVIDIGIAPTPTVQIATEELGAAGGISITASHNSQEWNGLKFLGGDGTFLPPNKIHKLKLLARTFSNYSININKILPPIDDYTWLEKHIEKVINLRYLNFYKIKKRRFRVVVDAVNASGSFAVPTLLERFNCEVIKLFCNGSGVFPHKPEPLPENLTTLRRAVKKYRADIGISVDPDTDRLVLITNEGKPFIEENTIVLASIAVLKYHKNRAQSITVNLSTTRAVDDIAKIFGAKVYRSPVGEINVVKLMKEKKSVIGGEGSGGVILPELHYGRDALVGIALVLQELADTNLSLSEYKKIIPEYYIYKTKIETKKESNYILNEILLALRTENCKIITLDGIKADYNDYWIHLRKSNTEPIIRIIIEAKNKKQAVKIYKRFQKKFSYILSSK
ncbi:MAG: phosphoglucosamine mutase [Ignavibacteria bacterium]